MPVQGTHAVNKAPSYRQMRRCETEKHQTPMMTHSGHPDGMCNSHIAVWDEAFVYDSILQQL